MGRPHNVDLKKGIDRAFQKSGYKADLLDREKNVRGPS